MKVLVKILDREGVVEVGELVKFINDVIVLIEDFVVWLKEEVFKKIGFLGIGRENYIWYM